MRDHPPAADPDIRALDPQRALQPVLAAGLIVHHIDPLNCETPLPGLAGGVITPTERFYVRNHFQIPELDPAAWRLEITGLVEKSLSLSLAALRARPAERVVATLECAGNGRAGLTPAVAGERWELGAAGTAAWTGVPLTDVLAEAGVRPGAVQALFRGADGGEVEERVPPIRFERSLPVDRLAELRPLLAYEMNGEPLAAHHGFPLRVVVPRWYGIASVKWLTEIELIDRPFAGHFQVDRYCIDGEPLTEQRVRSLILDPATGQHVPPGELVVRGVAWSGAAPVERVEVSVAGGPWRSARLAGEPRRESWVHWELPVRVEEAGTLAIRVRGTDRAGATQPSAPAWNPLGYANNAVQEVRVAVAAPAGGARPAAGAGDGDAVPGPGRPA